MACNRNYVPLRGAWTRKSSVNMSSFNPYPELTNPNDVGYKELKQMQVQNCNEYAQIRSRQDIEEGYCCNGVYSMGGLATYRDKTPNTKTTMFFDSTVENYPSGPYEMNRVSQYSPLNETWGRQQKFQLN